MSDVIVKDAVASIEPGDDDEQSPHGTFDVILSAPVKDRDGETLKPDEWEQPLPEHITFDIDHGMSVASTVGSGTPSIDEDGNLRVAGTYASTDLGQTTRALVNERHIRTTSVAFLRKTSKDRKTGTRVTRELLNGAFVAVPANPAALVLSSKALKEGRRNSASDATAIQAIHDSAATLGATCAGTSGKSTRKTAAETADSDRVAELERVIADVLDLVADVDPATLPAPVADALASLAEHGSNPDERSSAVDENADSSAAEAAEQSADESTADHANALALRAHGLRVLSASTST